MIPVHYHDAAEEELLDEIGYLELRTAGLGRRFFGEVRNVENLISRFPESGRELLPGIRRFALRKFRYSLIYTVQRNSVLILALAHHRRRPGYWAGRESPPGPS